MMTRIYASCGFLLLLALFLCHSPTHANTNTTQFSYVFPANISLKFIDGLRQEKSALKLTAIIESQLGELRNLEIFFDSSKDLKVISNTSNLSSLPNNSPRKVKILAIRTGEQPHELGSWIKMGVRYLPDYPQISNAINNLETYPDDSERQKLIEISNKNQQSAARCVEVIRYFQAR